MPDVKLIKPERLSDNPDGGGLSTGIEIPDNVVNNLFDDISRIDRVNGDVSLRKAFVQADTDDTELYSGLHVIVQAPPQDPRVDALLFRTGSWSDEREAAKQYVERFLDESVITRMIPYDRQLAGQRLIIVFQRPEVALPEIGDVYVLTLDDGSSFEFIRIQDVDHELQFFSDESGDYNARIVTLTITQPLSQEFAGTQPNRFFRADVGKSIVRKTAPSDAARYKATVPLAVDAEPGDLTLHLESVFGQLIPSTTSESAVTDAEPAGASVIAAASAAQTISISHVFDGPSVFHFGFGIGFEPGSVTFSIASGAFSGNVWTDNGDGTFTRTSVGAGFGDGAISVDYDTGVIRFDRGGSGSSGDVTVVIGFVAAATLSRSALSFQTPIKLNTRGYVYIASLKPVPVPRTLVVSYRALGRWYALVDDGTGQLVGEVGTGGGQINFTTGTVTVTLGALPDIGSSIIYAWGGDSELEIRTGDGAIQPPRVEIALTNELEPDSLELTWLAGGVTKTATANAAGIISGDAVGYVDTAGGRAIFRPTLIPDDNSTITAEYGDYDQPYQTEEFTPVEASGVITMTLADLPKPGTLTVLTLIYYRDGNQRNPYTFQLRDDGAGNLVSLDGNTPAEIASVGDVNYLTGVITLPASITWSSHEPVYEQLTDSVPQRTEDAETGYYTATSVPRKKATSFAYTSGTWLFNDSGVGMGGIVNIRYVNDAADVGAPYVEEFDMPPLRVDLTPNVSNAIVPGSLLLAFGGRLYIDRAGTLYHTITPATGAGTVGGTINYATGVASFTDYVGGASPAFSVKALLTEVDPLPVSVVHGRTPGSPLRPGSFFIQATRLSDSVVISAVADLQGKVDTADMHGYVDVVTGVFSVFFGNYVLDSSLTAEDKAEAWYNAANVDGGGYILRPREVVPGSIRFNCVVQTSLPLDPEIIGVNPVRLPLDGRVQVIRAGDTLVIHDTQAETFDNPIAAAEVVDVGRTDLATVVLYDQSGTAIPTTKYTVDLVTGIVTMADPLDLTGYVQPLVALHTIEDMALCIDAQITGEVTLAQALAHGYTAANSYCSSALILGDVQARVEALFAQNTWTSVWDDDLIGASPVSGAQYNDVTYPPVVTNHNAITQRWRLQFTSSGGGNIVAEELGIVGTFTTSADVAPINPATGEPYFTIDKDGFGSGWATGNLVRFNTVAAGGPIWIARSVKSGPATFLDDRIKLQTRWDKD